MDQIKQVFESERIRFVEVSEKLVEDYLVMINDVENVERFIGSVHEPFTAEKEIAWVHKKREEHATVFSMLEKESGEFIGNIELMDAEGPVRELGIALTAAKQGRGFGTEAVRALTAYGLEKLGLERITLRAKPFNARAIHVYEKCGFREYDRTEENICMVYAP